MTRLPAVLLIFGLVLGAPAGAAAHKGKRHHHHAKVYRAAIGPVGTDAAYAGIHGKAQVTDTRKRDKISIHMRGLKPGVTYPWHIHVAAAGVTDPCAEGAVQGPIVTEFAYKPLRARRSGNANSKGTARRYTFDKTKTYYVNVHDPASGAPIACGVLKKKRAKKAKPHRGHKPAIHRPKPDADRRGRDRGKDRDDD